MTATPGLGVTGNGVGVTTPLAHKLAQSGLIAKTGAGTNAIRAGIFYDGVTNIVTGAANMSYDVAAFTAALSRGATAGTVLLANDGTVNVVTAAAPASNSRIDIVYVWQREFSLDGTDSNPVISVAQGTAAASPVAPSLAAFPGALELARITVPAGVTATNTGTTITQVAPFTATAGGVIPFRTLAEMNAATVANDTLAVLIDSKAVYQRIGGAWKRGEHTNLQLDAANSTTQAITQRGIGKVTGNDTVQATKTVTFPVAFANANYQLSVTPIGYKNTGAFDATGIASASTNFATVVTKTATSFTVVMTVPSGTLAATLDYYYDWIAVGEV